MPFLQDKWEALSPKAQKIWQISIGVVLALATGYFIARPRPENAGFLDLNIIAAACLALLGPNICETQTGNKLPLLRKSMMIALLAVIVVFAANAFFGFIPMSI